MPRFTIKRLMLTIGVVACGLALFRALGPSAFVVKILPISLWGGVGIIIWRRPRLAVWGFAISALVANVSVGLLCVYLYWFGGILMFLAWIQLFPLVLGCGAAWLVNDAKTGRAAKSYAWFAVIGLTFLPLSTLITPWPLHLAFSLSRPWMDRLADRMAAGGTLTTPEWAGLYRVVGVTSDPNGGNVTLLIDEESGFLREIDPGSSSGRLTCVTDDVPVGGCWRYQIRED